MLAITVEQLMDFARRTEGDEWRTLVRNRSFQIEVNDDGITFTPASGHSRQLSNTQLAGFVDEYNELRSLSPGDYPDNFHKSYLLALIDRMLREP